MHNFFSAFKQVFRLRWINFIKISSLALGICISTALMCKVAWERSYDNFWFQKEKLLYLETNYAYQNEGDSIIDAYNMKCYPGLAPEIVNNITSVEASTRFRNRYVDYWVNNNFFSLITYTVDTSFFDMLQIKMIKGESPNAIFQSPGKIIISEKTATTLFSNCDPIGQQILNKSRFHSEDDEIYTVCGICQDLPGNSIFPNVQIIKCTEIPCVFDWGSSWVTLFRTYQNPDLEKLNNEINTLLKPRYKDLGNELISFRVNNIHNCHRLDVAENNAVLSVLAFALLLISGLSFVLLSINSLASRAKEVGVRKTAGAKVSGIFLLIILETVIYVLSATLLAALVFWGFKPQLENITGRYEDIFALANLWIAGIVLMLLIIVAGIIPAQILSRIPVTQVFQRFTADKIYWKRILLFIQFTASIFVICFMFIILRQYHTSFMRNFGYDKEKLLWISCGGLNTETQKQALMAEISSDSRVESISISNDLAWWDTEGMNVSLEPNTEDPAFVKWLGTDSLFFNTYGIPVLLGSKHLTANIDNGGNVVVNQFFLEKFNIVGNPLGQVFYYNKNHLATIVGVCGNFENVSAGVKPFVLMLRDSYNAGVITVRVNKVTKDVIAIINEKVKQFHQETIAPEVFTYSDNIIEMFRDVKMFRDKIILTSFFLLLITVMGILGYVNLEIRRRTKEITIRKIHGATAIQIIWKISRGLLLIAALSATVAIPAAYILGSRWQQEFTVKINLSWYLFAGATFVVVFTIAICAVLQTWRTANANPAKSLNINI